MSCYVGKRNEPPTLEPNLDCRVLVILDILARAGYGWFSRWTKKFMSYKADLRHIVAYSSQMDPLEVMVFT
jgi:hypothetical protein